MNKWLRTSWELTCLDSIWRTSASSSSVQLSPMIRLASRKRTMITTLEKGKEAKPSNLKKPVYGRKEPRQFPVLPTFPCAVKKATILLEEWVKEQVIHLIEVNYISSLKAQKDVRCSLNHWRKGHTLKQWVISGEFLTWNIRMERYGSRRVKQLPSINCHFLSMRIKGKARRWWPPCTNGGRGRWNNPTWGRAKPWRLVQQVQNLFKFTNFYG